MAKFSRRRFYRSPRDKYSVEQSSFYNTTNATGDQSFQLIPTTSTQGMRKVKHLTVSLTCNNARNGIFWALVYVPQGTAPTPLSISAVGAALYEPNQYVMNCGVVDPTAGPIRFSTPISRNLNSGDSIYLIVKDSSSAANVEIIGVVRYAITLQ